MRKLTLCFLLPVALGCTNRANASNCASLDAESKKAVQYLVDDAGNRIVVPVDDKDELRWAWRTLRNSGAKTVPCLLEIYRVGPGPTGFWPAESEAPKDGRWALALIRDIDPSAALPLYRELRAAAADDLTRMHYGAELAFAGDRQLLGELVTFLNAPPAVTDDHRRDLVIVEERILDAISVNNYKPAVPVLRRMAETWVYPDLVKIVIAQLTGDSAALDRLAAVPMTGRPALLALLRDGKKERIKEIAADTGHPCRSLAKAILDDPTSR